MSSGRVSAYAGGLAGAGEEDGEVRRSRRSGGGDLQSMLEAGRTACRLEAFDLAAALAEQVLDVALGEPRRLAAEALLLLGIARAGRGEVEVARALLASGLRDLGGEVASPFLAPGLYLLCWLSLERGDRRAARITAEALRALAPPGNGRRERPLLDALFARLDGSPVDATVSFEEISAQTSLSSLIARLL